MEANHNHAQARATECHAVAALAHSMVGMALEVVTTPVSLVANNIDRYSMNSNTNWEERDAQPPAVGWDLETRVSRTGY
jgi:hypothetical protein